MFLYAVDLLAGQACCNAKASMSGVCKDVRVFLWVKGGWAGMRGEGRTVLDTSVENGIRDGGFAMDVSCISYMWAKKYQM